MIGWECPKCGAVYGPQVDACVRCVARSYTGTGCLVPDSLRDSVMSEEQKTLWAVVRVALDHGAKWSEAFRTEMEMMLRASQGR